MNTKHVVGGTILVLVFLVLGIHFLSTQTVPGPTPVNSSTTDRIVMEAIRLSGVAQDRNLTETDFTVLKGLTINHAALSGETEEAIWMVNHGFTHHATHSLNAIISIAETGEYICPADSLSHIRPYLEFNELERAQEVEAEGKKSLPAWVAIVHLARKNGPDSYMGAETLIAQMNATIAAFEAGDMNAAAEASGVLEKTGYC